MGYIIGRQFNFKFQIADFRLKGEGSAKAQRTPRGEGRSSISDCRFQIEGRGKRQGAKDAKGRGEVFDFGLQISD